MRSAIITVLVAIVVFIIVVSTSTTDKSAILNQDSENFISCTVTISAKDYKEVMEHLSTIKPEGLRQTITIEKKFLRYVISIYYSVDDRYLSDLHDKSYEDYLKIKQKLMERGYLE